MMRASTPTGTGPSGIHRQTFRSGSRTYYNSSRFFPKSVRADVFVLYGFVRVADNFVDRVPQDAGGFRAFRARFQRARGAPEDSNEDAIIGPFVELTRRHRMPPEWADAFLDSMEMDLSKRVYETLEETLRYVYGSAEVIGLFMARLMGLPQESYHSARMLGRAMQYINFIRDMDEDRALGRFYLPWNGSSRHIVDRPYALSHQEEFRAFVEHQLGLYRGWQAEAEEGFAYLPRRYRIPIRTASDMYAWTADQIERDPLVVFRRTVKPSKARILLSVLFNAVSG